MVMQKVPLCRVRNPVHYLAYNSIVLEDGEEKHELSDVYIGREAA